MTKLFIFIMVAASLLGISTVNLFATNCADGQEQVSYVAGAENIDKEKRSGTWYFTVTVPVTMTLNCDADPCITKMKGHIMVHDVEGSNIGGGGETSGVESGTCNLCNKGDSFDYIIIFTPSAGDAWEPMTVSVTF